MTHIPMTPDIEFVEPEPTDDGDEPITLVYVSIFAVSGMRYSNHCAVDGDPGPEATAEMIVAAMRRAAATHSPDLAAALERRLRP